MEGGVGGKPVRGGGSGLTPRAPKRGPKSNIKKDPKNTTKRGTKGDPKNHKKAIRAEFLGVLDGELKMELRSGFQKVRFWCYLLHLS